MYLIRLITPPKSARPTARILRVLRRDTHHDAFKVELERRLWVSKRNISGGVASPRPERPS